MSKKQETKKSLGVLIKNKLPDEFANKERIILFTFQIKDDEYSDWNDDEWTEFGLHSLFNSEDDKNIDWEGFFGVKS